MMTTMASTDHSSEVSADSSTMKGGKVRSRSLRVLIGHGHGANRTKEDKINDLLYPERDFWRPRVREDCTEVSRPCPYVACRHNMYLDVIGPRGSIRFNYPDKQPWDIDENESCSLDIIESRLELSIREVGMALGITHEGARQIELKAKESLGLKLHGLSADLMIDSVSPDTHCAELSSVEPRGPFEVESLAEFMLMDMELLTTEVPDQSAQAIGELIDKLSVSVPFCRFKK